MKRLPALILFIAPQLAAAEYSRILEEAEWSRPRTAQVVQQFPAVQAVVQRWLQSPQKQRIELRYPGGETGSLWALELRDWLVALGVPSHKIETYPGHPQVGELALVLLP